MNRAPTCEGYAFEGTRWHGDMGTRERRGLREVRTGLAGFFMVVVLIWVERIRNGRNVRGCRNG